MEEWDGGERQRKRWEQQAALETGTETEAVIDCNRNRNCKGQQEIFFWWGNKIFGERCGECGVGPQVRRKGG